MIHKLKAALLCLAVALTVALVPAQATYANCTERDFLSFPSWNSGLTCDETGTDREHVVIGEDDIPKFIWTVVLNVLDILFRIAGILAVIMLIVSGYQYLASTGVPDKISKAKSGMIRAIVGLVIALLSSTIIYFIVGQV
jgi:hypothetical protein